MKQQSVLATTHVDLHFDRITKEALDGAAADIEAGSRPLLTVEHDMTIPPMGKMLQAWVEPRDDGEYQLVVVKEYFEGFEPVRLPDGTQALKQGSREDQRPFADRYAEMSDGFEIAVDRMNFQSPPEMRTFLQEVREASGVEFQEKGFGRKSVIPDPEIIIKIGEVVSLSLLAKKVIDKAGDKLIEQMGDDIARAYTFVKSAIFAMAKYARPKNRPVTYVFVVSKNPAIEFIARSNHPDLVASAVLFDNLKESLADANQLHETLGAVRIQYLLNDTGSWEFNYLLTATGDVIGTERSFSRRNRRFELLLREGESRGSSKVTSATRRKRKRRR